MKVQRNICSYVGSYLVRTKIARMEAIAKICHENRRER